MDEQTERVRIEVAQELKDYLESLKLKLAEEICKTYNLTTVIVNGTFTSQVLASRLRGVSKIDFKIRKTGLNKGIIEFA